MAVGAGIVNDYNVSDLGAREQSVDGKLVVVFTEAAGYVVARSFPGASEDGNVMVGAIHCGAHKVGHCGIEADEVFVRLLDVANC